MLVVEVDVEVVMVLVVTVDVDVVVVSHPVHVLEHCSATKGSRQRFKLANRSHLIRGNKFILPTHLCSVDVVVVNVDVEVEVLVDVDVDVVVPHVPSLSASFSGCTGQGSSFPHMPSLSTSFSGSAAHVSKHSDSHAQEHVWHIECARHLPLLAPPLL